jgi:DNA polymerase III delta prime subunit
MRDDFLFTEKYRPKTVKETILPDDLKKTFQQFVDQENIPNLLLTGGPGIGKTTIAKAMLEELGCDYIVINSSMNGNIDTLRYEIMNFASSVSLMGGRKYVILDEADYLNPNSTQPALRNFMEEYSKNCGFILTCNYKNRIIKELHSRCSVIDFTVSKKDAINLAEQFYDRVTFILKTEGIGFEPAAVASVIKKYYPDWRRCLNEFQRYSALGKIDVGILTNIQETSIGELLKEMKAKNFTAVRKWVGENLDSNSDSIYRKLYDSASVLMETSSIPALVVILGKYQYQGAFSVDQEINLSAGLAEIMGECVFK